MTVGFPLPCGSFLIWCHRYLYTKFLQQWLCLFSWPLCWACVYHQSLQSDILPSTLTNVCIVTQIFFFILLSITPYDLWPFSSKYVASHQLFNVSISKFSWLLLLKRFPSDHFFIIPIKKKHSFHFKDLLIHLYKNFIVLFPFLF